MHNYLTFDVEDWAESTLELFEIPVTRPTYPTESVVQQTLEVLDILTARQVKATFFILGTVAEKFPELVSEIGERGHEIGSHGYRHRLINRQTADEFSADITRAVSVLASVGKQKPISYRAPFFSITAKSPWALDVLAKHGFLYDSSIFPIRRPLYGIPGAPRFTHNMRTDSGLTITEIPLSTLRCFGTNFPVAGGGYFRIMPFSLTRRAIRRLNAQGYPAVVYIHPHDLFDLPELPQEIQQRKKGGSSVLAEVLLRVQTLGRTGAKEKLLRLLDEFEFSPIKQMPPSSTY